MAEYKAIKINTQKAMNVGIVTKTVIQADRPTASHPSPTIALLEPAAALKTHITNSVRAISTDFMH
jgi:hypothetical protein